ncbi:hypothetical protein ACWCPQ_06730 [Nocardia sp. NPDC001965]
MISDHLDEFGGLPVHDFPLPWQDEEAGPPPGAASVAWRIAWRWVRRPSSPV